MQNMQEVLVWLEEEIIGSSIILLIFVIYIYICNEKVNNILKIILTEVQL